MLIACEIDSHPLPWFSSNADSELDALYDKMNHVTLDDVLNGNYPLRCTNRCVTGLPSLPLKF